MRDGVHRPPVRRVRPHPALHALGAAAVLALVLTGCGGPETGATRGDAPFIEPPGEGTILLYQPPQASGRRRQGRAEMIRITTERSSAVMKDSPMQVAGGEIEDDVPESRTADRSIAKEIIRNSMGRPFVVSPERFARICADLEEAGLFLLPRFRGGIPPMDKPYISLSAGGRTSVFLRPTDAPVRDLPKDPETRQKTLAAWGQAKLTILICTQGG